MSIFTRIKDWIFGESLPGAQAQSPVNINITVNPGETEAPRDGRKPRILISGGGDDSKSIAAAVAMIRGAGGEPVVITNHAELVQQLGSAEQAVAPILANVDGVMVMGSDTDHDPAKYGQAKNAATKLAANSARSDVDDALIGKALESGVPLLGVCAGMQAINIHDHKENGGTLHQHVPDIVGDNHHMQGADDQDKIPPFVPVQFVAIQPDTALSAIAGSTPGLYTPQHGGLPPGVVMENSFHHQAVNKVHKEFRAAAVSDDGIIEAIEPKQGGKYDHQFVMGVQWHPEFGASDLGAKLAATFTEAARNYVLGKEQKHPEHRIDQALANAIQQGPMVARLMMERQQRAILGR